MSQLRFLVVLSIYGILGAAYTWPSPQLDELESLHYDQGGYNAHGSIFVGGVTPCTLFLFGNTPGRSNAAEWIRTAYHDMATYNVKDGTGGLDGSIRIPEEQDRAENAGTGFANTFRFIASAANRYASVADVVALAAVTAIEQCGGPKIPFRGGRIDAMQPNNPGVPEPQQDLATHTANFARQGFTPTEMISLISCGHSFGGVQRSAFPGIVPAGADPSVDVAQTFDVTSTRFDNQIAVDYMNGTTLNPLVVGHNDTTNSDKRIFSSDNNATMRSFAESPKLFASTCTDLFARMLDTVPTGVVLTEVIEPLPVKPQGVALTFMGDGSLVLRGEVRFWNMAPNVDRSITLRWADRSGMPCADCTAPLGHTEDQVSSAHSGTDHTALWYSFGATETSVVRVDAAAGISRFWFEIDEGASAGVRTEDQSGEGFALQDTVMVANSTCLDVGNGRTATLDIAVRKDATPSRVYLEFDTFDEFATPTVSTIDVPVPTTTSEGEYEIRSIEVTSGSFNVAANVGDRKLTTEPFQLFTFAVCT